ncbi:MAG TPA: hypothetical protein VLV50_06805 [Stellaceae bacterium]|nr:hypothetical protein [Stellaceae bacterium]
MRDGTEFAVNGKVTGAAYFRGRARTFRRQAGTAGDPVVHHELLRLADIYERLAENAEIEARA